MTDARPIRRLLIANRGEIAVRIARGARACDIVPLGVYSDADAHAYFLDFVDDAARLGPAPAAESYLDIERVLDAARVLAADAIHPGYGFLSERAPFAQAVVDAGLIFVGPPPAAIAAMGDKTEAKRRARAQGVPVVAGYDGDDQSSERLTAEAHALGVPLMIKARAGGGGRGMRVVTALNDFGDALESAKREAAAAFGDDGMLLERYIERPRHIEFQILADMHGHTIHLGERECSIQRRHQKIIEEAPSVALTADLRARMGAAAVAVARSVGYVNAGTVEFLLDARGAFSFLEMNARLQVEHPVTELVHGIDLVRLQLEIASGAPLAIEQAHVEARGWAVEARINAEDASRGYLPASGTIARFEAPDGPGLRLDTGVTSGSVVSIYYDSLMAKLIAFGPDRASAVDRLTSALETIEIDGVRTNVPLLLQIARDPVFRAGEATTAFLAEREHDAQPGTHGEPDAAFLIAVGAVLADPRSWRVGHVGIPVRLAGATRDVSVFASRHGSDAHAWRLTGGLESDVRFEVANGRVVATLHDARIGGRASVGPDGVSVSWSGERYAFRFPPPPQLGETAARARGASRGAVTSPMPGKIVKVAVRAGETVADRTLLVVLEAMKMEHRIEATQPGVVKQVAVAPGDLVAGGATLVEFE